MKNIQYPAVHAVMKYSNCEMERKVVLHRKITQSVWLFVIRTKIFYYFYAFPLALITCDPN